MTSTRGACGRRANWKHSEERRKEKRLKEKYLARCSSGIYTRRGCGGRRIEVE